MTHGVSINSLILAESTPAWSQRVGRRWSLEAGAPRTGIRGGRSREDSHESSRTPREVPHGFKARVNLRKVVEFESVHEQSRNILWRELRPRRPGTCR